jgi:type I restriction enzyme S subunit
VSSPEQDEIVARLEGVEASTKDLERTCQQKLIALAELKQSLLQKAFSGELTEDKEALNVTLKEEEVA